MPRGRRLQRRAVQSLLHLLFRRRGCRPRRRGARAGPRTTALGPGAARVEGHPATDAALRRGASAAPPNPCVRVAAAPRPRRYNRRYKCVCVCVGQVRKSRKAADIHISVGGLLPESYETSSPTCSLNFAKRMICRRRVFLIVVVHRQCFGSTGAPGRRSACRGTQSTCARSKYMSSALALDCSKV